MSDLSEWVDWSASMQQSYEFYKVDPDTWKDAELIDTALSCSITRDSDDETLGYATIDSTEEIEECYVRIYLSIIQNGKSGRIPLGTYLVQTPSISFDGKNKTISMDAYTPLIELKGSYPEAGYTLFSGSNVLDYADTLATSHMRAPTVASDSSDKLESDFIANLDDTWLSFVSDLLATASYTFDIDENGQVLYAPIQDLAAMSPVYTYTDDNSSILLPDIEDERDLYDVPNVVEVIYSTGTGYIKSRVENTDLSSPISIPNRGREVVYRDSSPSLSYTPTQAQLNLYAIDLLKSKSCLEHTLTYSHGYCPVRVGDCVLLNYARSGIYKVKAKVTSQTISCETGCTVEETAVYTESLWG